MKRSTMKGRVFDYIFTSEDRDRGSTCTPTVSMFRRLVRPSVPPLQHIHKNPLSLRINHSTLFFFFPSAHTKRFLYFRTCQTKKKKLSHALVFFCSWIILLLLEPFLFWDPAFWLPTCLSIPNPLRLIVHVHICIRIHNPWVGRH